MAGLEERLSKLEKILHKFFCCDVPTQGPTGPQGPPGIGTQGPQGPAGPIGPAGLTWQGQWVPCNVYQQNDAVGFNGASYYVTCENSGVTEACESPYDNSTCWALLANVGATGPMGPAGPSAAPKTYGTVYTTSNPYSTLVYDFNDVYTQDIEQGILLPSSTIIGTEIVLFSSLNNDPFKVLTDNTETLISIRTKNLEEEVAILSVFPGDTYRFTLIDLVDDGKGGFEPLWFSESINGIPYKYNDNNLVETGFQITSTAQNLTADPLSLTFLNNNYGSNRGVRVYCPTIGIVYDNVGGGYWTEQPITTVV